MTREADVVVVGAGLAGLVAARDIVRAGREAVVVEARDRVGGRLLNHPLGDGQVVEVGGQWIGPTQDALQALADELGVEMFPTWTKGESILVLDGATSRFTGEFPSFGESTLTDIANGLVALEQMASEVPLEAPWTAPQAAAWDAQTFQSWIDANATDPGARAMFDLIAGAVFTAAAAELSLLHVLFYIRSAGNLSPMLTDVEGGAQERRFVGGSHRLCELMADELGDRVVLSAPVRTISQGGDRVRVESDAASFEGTQCVVAVPPTVADRIAFDPPLPSGRAQLQRRMAAGSVIKCNVVYDTPFWRDEELSGRIVDPDGPATITFDNSPDSGSPGVLLAFLEADHARRLGALPAAERRSAVLEQLGRHFGPRTADPVAFVEKDWDAEEWTRGCYGANLPPGAWTRYGPYLREPVGRIRWASAETATVWANYMDGAVSSGHRAASEVLDALG